MREKLIWAIFWALVGVFVLLVGIMASAPLLIPLHHRVYLGFFFSIGALLLPLGIAYLVLTIKGKANGVFKKFQILTGASAVGLPIAAILHNVVSALFNIEEPVFFIMATMVCPIGFLVGAVGILVFMIRSKQVKQSNQD